jgi:hypothetical protein
MGNEHLNANKLIRVDRKQFIKQLKMKIVDESGVEKFFSGRLIFLIVSSICWDYFRH